MTEEGTSEFASQSGMPVQHHESNTSNGPLHLPEDRMTTGSANFNVERHCSFICWCLRTADALQLILKQKAAPFDVAAAWPTWQEKPTGPNLSILA